ncbi:jg19372 [Pararge aegeria aegeria]|uniref:Jg19372 protein n=1 Tax=Pararge aegeria aegeria TaxID=348720 RepID=A0A8S4R907_9NEOP|nr:jg19372 [Pararge aegeria aegeria]
MIPALQVSAWPNINSLSCLLDDIYERYIKLKLEDSQLYNKVFTEVFGRLHDHMKAVDKYYGRYSSNIQFVGSPKDRLRINKPDGFKIDLDIVISLPINACTETL